MNKYLEAEKKLAELLGWTHLKSHEVEGHPKQFRCEGIRPEYPHGPIVEVISWTRDDAAAFQLMVAYGCYPDSFKNQIWVGDGDCPHMQCENIENHPDKLTATRYAIVMAVISKLENT